MSSSKSSSSAAKKARDTLSIIYDAYAGRPASKESVEFGIAVGDIPTESQTDSLKKKLAEMAKMQEILNSVPAEEIKRMENAAKTSQGKRKKR